MRKNNIGEVPLDSDRLTRTVLSVSQPRNVIVSALVLLTSWELGVRMLDDAGRGYSLYRVVLIVSMSVIAVVVRLFVRDFLASVKAAKSLFPESSQHYFEWRALVYRATFSFRSPSSMTITIMLFLATANVIKDPPQGFRDYSAYLVHILPLWIVFAVPLVGANITKGSILSLITLSGIRREMIKTSPFDPGLQIVEVNFGRMSAYSAIAYLGFPLTGLLSPYGFGPKSKLFLAVVGMFPLLNLLGSTWCLSTFRRTMRDALLTDLGARLRTCRDRIKTDASTEAVIELHSILSSMDVVGKFPVVPFNIAGVLSVAISSAAAVYQFADIALKSAGP